LTAASTLLTCADQAGLDTLIQCTRPAQPENIRKTAAFLLATELPVQLTHAQRQEIAASLIPLLFDGDSELALQAAHALSRTAAPELLPILKEMLDNIDPQKQIIVLTVLEEVAHQAAFRHSIHLHALPAQIAPLLKAEHRELRRQASYTLAACGGEYAAAVFGTILLNQEHPGYIDAIEGLRLFQGILRAPLRAKIVKWLLRILRHQHEEIQVTALDSLSYLLLQARSKSNKQAWQAISNEIIAYDLLLPLLRDSSAWVRQRTIELLGLLWYDPDTQLSLFIPAVALLHTDEDVGVRASIALALGQVNARWSIPHLLQALHDPDEMVANCAFQALCKLCTEEDAQFVIAVKNISSYANTHENLAKSARTLLKQWGLH
jgi:HEAT repeat protein